MANFGPVINGFHGTRQNLRKNRKDIRVVGIERQYIRKATQLQKLLISLSGYQAAWCLVAFWNFQ
jgi:hypothetical protein